MYIDAIGYNWDSNYKSGENRLDMTLGSLDSDGDGMNDAIEIIKNYNFTEPDHQ